MAGDSTSYIKHHLTNLTYGELPTGYERADGTVMSEASWTLAQNGAEAWLSDHVLIPTCG